MSDCWTGKDTISASQDGRVGGMSDLKVCMTAAECDLCDGLEAELDRLRAELDKQLAEDLKIDRLQAEIDRLRDENAELRTFIKNFAYSEEFSGRSMRLFANSAYELLAKTAKEGE